MNTMKRLATPLMAAVLIAGATAATYAQSATQNPQEPSTAAMPAGNPESQQAYEDGKLAAKLDTVAKRPVDAKMSHLYKKPPVKGAAQAEYRANFEKGYNDAVKNGSL